MKCEIIEDPGLDGIRVRVDRGEDGNPFDVCWSGTALRMLTARGVLDQPDALTVGIAERLPDVMEGWTSQAAAARASDGGHFPRVNVNSDSVRLLNDVLSSLGLPILGA